VKAKCEVCEDYFVVNFRGEEIIIVFLFSCIIRDTVNLVADYMPLKMSSVLFFSVFSNNIFK